MALIIGGLYLVKIQQPFGDGRGEVLRPAVYCGRCGSGQGLRFVTYVAARQRFTADLRTFMPEKVMGRWLWTEPVLAAYRRRLRDGEEGRAVVVPRPLPETQTNFSQEWAPAAR